MSDRYRITSDSDALLEYGITFIIFISLLTGTLIAKNNETKGETTDVRWESDTDLNMAEIGFSDTSFSTEITQYKKYDKYEQIQLTLSDGTTIKVNPQIFTLFNNKSEYANNLENKIECNDTYKFDAEKTKKELGNQCALIEIDGKIQIIKDWVEFKKYDSYVEFVYYGAGNSICVKKDSYIIYYDNSSIINEFIQKTKNINTDTYKLKKDYQINF